MSDYFEHSKFDKQAINIFLITLVLAFVSILILSNNNALGFVTISVGPFPIPVIVNQNTNMIYVGNAGSNTVSVINGSSNIVLTNVTVGFSPAGLALDSNANIVYVSNLNSNNVSVINATTNTVVATIPVGALPVGIGVDNNLERVYVANEADGTVSVIDVLPGSPTKYSVISTIPLNTGIRALAVIPNNHEVIVTSGVSDILYVLNGTTNTLITALHIGIAADPVAVNPTNNLVYTADLGTGTVTVVNGTSNTVIASIPVGNNPDGVAVNSITKNVYVANFVDNTVAVINSTTNTVIGKFQVFTPSRVAVNEVTDKIYVGNLAFHSITVLDGTAPNPPLANAGPDQTVTSGSIVTLQGSSTSQGNLTFSWVQTAGPSVTLSSSNIANPNFTAPIVNTATLLTFQLIVNDGISNSVPSFVNVVVNPIRTFTVNLVPTSLQNLTGGVNIGNVANGTITTLLFNTPTGILPFAQLEQNVIPSAVNGNNVALNFTVSSNAPNNLPKPPVNQALFFDVTPSGIDFSKSSSFLPSQPPLVRFQVNSNFTSKNRFSDGCPVIPILLFNDSTKQWQQLGDPQKLNTNKIFVPNANTNTVSVIDGKTNTVTATIPVGGSPGQLSFDPGNNMVYVPNRSTNNVSVIDTVTNTVVATIPVGINPTMVTALPSINKVYVANAGSGTVSVIDTQSGSPTVNTVVDTIPVGQSPFNLRANPNTNRVYVANFFSDSISVINGNTDTVLATIPVTNLPGQIGVNPATNKIYVANYFERIVWVIDGTPGSPTENSITSTIIVGNNPTGMAIDPGTNMMYVSNGFPNTVSVIDLSINVRIATIPVGYDPTAVAINLNTKRLYVSNAFSNTVSIIDVLSGSPTENMVISTINAGNSAVAVDVNQDVPNPVRDPSTDVIDNNTGKIFQCSYLANLPHLSRFAVGGIIQPALALLGIGGSPGGSATAPSMTVSSFSGGTTLPDSVKKIISDENPFTPIAPLNDPSIDLPLTINGNGFPIASSANTIQTQSFQTGQPISLKLVFHDPYDIEHVSLFSNLQGASKNIADSDTAIIYENDQDPQIVDPHGYFSNVKITKSTNGNRIEFDYDITFAKPMAKSDIILRSWNSYKASSDIDIMDAWEVTQAQTNQENLQNQIPQTQAPIEDPVPDLLPEIKKWSGYSSTSISDSQLLSDLGIKGQHIPSWVMKTSKWVINGDVTQQEFVNALNYLHGLKILN